MRGLKKTSGILQFVTLPLETLDKINLNPWKFWKIVLHHLEIPRPKSKTQWKFQNPQAILF